MGGSGWGINVNPWLIHVNVWQKPLQYCKVMSLQLLKINGKKMYYKKKKDKKYDPITKDWKESRMMILTTPPFYSSTWSV